MEDAFLELYQEFRKLQIICEKQAELLQKLLSKNSNGFSNEMPVSKPIQCTDTGDNVCSESPFFKLKCEENHCAEASKADAEDLPVSLEPKENSSLLLDLDVRFPPCENQYNFLASAADKEEAVGSMPCAGLTSDKKGTQSNYALFIKNYPQVLDMDNVGGKIDPAKLYLDFMTYKDHNFSLSNMYEDDISFLQSKDISVKQLLEPHEDFDGVRGPAKSSWSPACLSEDCQSGPRVDALSDVRLSSQICEFCHAVFPAGAATEGEFLGHLTGHME